MRTKPMSDERLEELRHMVKTIGRLDVSHGSIFDKEVRECVREIDRLRRREKALAIDLGASLRDALRRVEELERDAEAAGRALSTLRGKTRRAVLD